MSSEVACASITARRGIRGSVGWALPLLQGPAQASLAASERGRAKGRSSVVCEPRPYERSRWAAHGGSCSIVEVCPPHRGQSWSHRPESRATRRGRNVKAAPTSKGKRRGQGHYRGRDSVEPRPFWVCGYFSSTGLTNRSPSSSSTRTR